MEPKYKFIMGHEPGDVVLQDEILNLIFQEFLLDLCLENHFP